MLRSSPDTGELLFIDAMGKQSATRRVVVASRAHAPRVAATTTTPFGRLPLDKSSWAFGTPFLEDGFVEPGFLFAGKSHNATFCNRDALRPLACVGRVSVVVLSWPAIVSAASVAVITKLWEANRITLVARISPILGDPAVEK